jgi:hypothetical protein
VPANARVDDGGTGLLDSFRKEEDLIPAAAIRDEVDERQTIDDDEILTERFAHSPHNFKREADLGVRERERERERESVCVCVCERECVRGEK